MKMTLDLPSDLVREMKLQAVHEERKLKDVAAELIRRGLMSPAGRASIPLASSPMVRIAKDGLPVARCIPNAPAGKMSVEELLALEQQSLDEEDLKRAGPSF